MKVPLIMRSIVFVSLMLFSGFVQSSLAAEIRPKQLVGSFTSKVTDPDGTKYEGTCEITHKAGRTLEMVWVYGAKKSVGMGKLDGDVLTIEYEGAIANRMGKARYEVKSEDRLTGQFKRKGTKGLGSEILLRVKP